MARAMMKSLMVIRDIIQSSSNNDLKRLFAWVLGESRVIASWAAREMGDHSEARRIAFAALTKRLPSLNDDIHFFVILKGRQLGITTISLALDLYCHFKHPGFQETLTTDTEENRDQFRTTLAMYIDGLPPEYKIPLVTHNRNQMVLKNRSRLFYQVAGLRAKGSLGRGKGITYLHGTETSSWGDEEGLASLLASLAEKNPNRLYLFESTARGFNMWHDMWAVAKRA